MDLLLQDTRSCDTLDVVIDVVPAQFPTRLAVAEHLYNLLDQAGLTGLDSDQGLWTWLSAFYFEQLCPPNRGPGERARWVPAINDFRSYYRHLLAGPYQIYRAHRDDPLRAMVLLATPPHLPGDVVEQLASRQEFVTNSTVMQVATTLYVSEDGSIKTGAGGGGRNGGGPGNVRRLVHLLNQLDLTWDVYSLTVDTLLDMLPAEFDRFRS